MQQRRTIKSLVSILMAGNLVVASWGQAVQSRVGDPIARGAEGLGGELGTPDPTPPGPPKAFDLPEVPIVAGAGEGYVPSSWGVGSDGQLSYSLPLDVPKGRAGMQPTLALAYSSAGGNGPAGMGWVVAGASSMIVRGGKSLSTDGVKSGVTFDKATDRFYLDGQELVAVGREQGTSGEYGDSGTEYRTETDTFAQIWSVGSEATIASGPDAFVVLTKDGKTLRYTPRSATRTVSGIGDSYNPWPYATYVQSSVAVRAVWLLESVRDRSGNEIHYDYQDFSDARGMEVQPWRITYTWGDGGVAGQRRVEFDYDPGDRVDVAVEFQAGVAYKRAKRLRSIKMYAPNPASSQMVWEYRFLYKSSSTKRSLLASVAKCGPSTACLKAKQFTYDDTVLVPTFTPVQVGLAVVDVTGTPVPAMQVADFDGDGADDILLHRGGGNPPEVQLGQRVGTGAVLPLNKVFSALGPDFPASTTLGHGRPVDVQRDGKVEFMVQYKDVDDKLRDKILVWDTTLNKFVKATEPGNPLNSLQGGWSNFGDVDGDGLLDYLSLNGAGQVVLRRWSIGLGGPWGPATTTNFVVMTGCPNSMVDVDGDGRAELLAYKDYKDKPWSTCDEELYALSFNGVDLTARAMSFENASVKAYRASSSTYQRGDFNGDGLVDSWWHDRVGWNTGAGLRLATPRVNKVVPGCDNLAADMNGDGRDDLMAFAATGIWVSASYGDGTFAPPVQIAADAGTAVVTKGCAARYSTTKLGDFNADGRTDIVRIVDGQMSVLLQQANYFQDRLMTVRDEGVPWDRETVSYANNWSEHMEKMFDYSCWYSLVCHRRGMPVVRKVASKAHNADVATAASATSREMRYTFADPVSDLRGRGFLGFGTMRVWDPAPPRETVTTYAHRKQVDGKYYPEVGAASVVTTAVPIVTATKTGTSTETARIIRTYHTHTTVKTHDLNGRTTYTVQPTSSYTKEWEEPVTVRWSGGLGTTDPTEHVSAIAEPGEDAALRVVRVDAQFDGYGSLTKHTQQTYGPGMELPLVAEQVAMTYDNRFINAEHDGADWLIGLLTQRKVTRTDTAHGIKTVTRTTDFTHDALGRLQKVEIEKASTNPDVRQTTTYGYDALGVQTRVTTVAGDPAAPSLPTQETHSEYAQVFPGQPDEGIYPSQIWRQHVPATMRSSTWLATHPGYGVTVATMDANGVRTQSTFDEFGRPLTVQRDGQAQSSYSYAGRPDTAGGIDGVIATATRASITSTSYTDVLGRSLQSTLTGFDGTPHTVSKTSYDLFGRIHTATAAAPVGTTSSAYDSLGRLVTTTLPDGTTVTYTHTFDTTTTVDPSGQKTTLTFDVAGRTISSTDVDKQADGSSTNITTRYEYAPFDLPAKVIDAQDNTTSIEYDVRGRRTTLTEPDRGVTETTFYGTGQVRTTRHPAANLTSTFAYDDMGRTTSRVDDNGTTALTTSYIFDAAPHGIGAMAAASSPDGITTAFRYDTAGRPTGTDVTDQSAWVTFSIDYGYDTAGRLTSLHYPDTGNGRLVLQHDYLSHGYLNALRYAKPEHGQLLDLWTIQSRQPNLALDTATLANGVTLTRSYDNFTGRLHTLSATTAPGATLQHLTYSYYANGLVKTRTQNDNQAVRSEEFYYDTLGRLTGWDLIPPNKDQTNTSYTYDTLSNLTATNNDHGLTETLVYGKPDGSQPHTLTGVTATCPTGQSCRNDTPQYDARGRQTSGNGRTVTYTAFDLPKTITRRGQIMTFAYDAFEQRVKKTSGPNITYTVGGIYEKRMTSNTVKHIHHLNSPDGRIAQAVYDGTTTDLQYHLTDHLGSITSTHTATGATTGSFYFNPFGRRINADDTTFIATTGDTKHGFTGHEHDDALDLINMKGRIYDPTQQQFLTPDPIISDPLNGHDYNTYSYVRNSPLNYTDPTGYKLAECNQMPSGGWICGGDAGGGWAPAEQRSGGSGWGSSGGGGGGFDDSGWGRVAGSRGAAELSDFFHESDARANGGAAAGQAYHLGGLFREAARWDAQIQKRIAVLQAMAELEKYLARQASLNAVNQGRAPSGTNTTAPTSDAGGMLRAGDASLLLAGEDLRLADNTLLCSPDGTGCTPVPEGSKICTGTPEGTVGCTGPKSVSDATATGLTTSEKIAAWITGAGAAAKAVADVAPGAAPQLTRFGAWAVVVGGLTVGAGYYFDWLKKHGTPPGWERGPFYGPKL